MRGPKLLSPSGLNWLYRALVSVYFLFPSVISFHIEPGQPSVHCAFKFLNAMLMPALHSLVSLLPLACLPQFAANGPPTNPLRFHPPFIFLSYSLSFFLSVCVCASLSSLEASRFSSYFTFESQCCTEGEWVGGISETSKWEFDRRGSPGLREKGTHSHSSSLFPLLSGLSLLQLGAASDAL